jgi:hypothetical protein
MLYRLVDMRLRVTVNAQPINATPAAAMELNRDLYLAGDVHLGWIDATRIDERGRVQSAPATSAPTRAPVSAELVEALVRIGYRKGRAKELAATAPAGSVEDSLRFLFRPKKGTIA